MAGRRASLATAAGGLGLLLLATACNGQVIAEDPTPASDAGSGSASDASTGTIHFILGLPVDVLVSTVDYSVSGSGGFSTGGAVKLSGSDSVRIEFDVGDLPAGGSDVVALDVVTPDPATACAASGKFTVVAGATTTVVLEATCTGTGMASLGLTSPPPPDPPPSGRGTLTVDAILPAGPSFSSALCELDGQGALLFSESLTVNGPALSFTLQNIPAGNGESLVLTATSTDGSEACRAMTTFDILAQQTTSTTLIFSCAPAPHDS